MRGVVRLWQIVTSSITVVMGEKSLMERAPTLLNNISEGNGGYGVDVPGALAIFVGFQGCYNNTSGCITTSTFLNGTYSPETPYIHSNPLIQAAWTTTALTTSVL
jgi:hypothetical protein